MSGTGIDISPDMDPKDVLAHYGVPGMQWGKTKSSGSGSAEGGSSKPTTDQIKLARDNVQGQALDLRKAKREVKATTAKGSVERMMADEKLAGMKADLLNNPDRVTATYLTKGEKVIFGALALTPGGAPAIAGNIVGRRIGRNVVAKKQATGAYDR